MNDARVSVIKKIKWSRLTIVFLVAGFALACGVAPQANAVPLVINGVENAGFEATGAATPDAIPTGWTAFWARDANGGEMALDETVRHSGERALKVTHRGALDWSAAQAKTINVTPGDIFSMRAWLKSEVMTDAEIGVIARRADGTAIDWMLGRTPTSGTHDWRLFSRRFVVPPDCAKIQFRLTGNGPGTVWMDDAELLKTGNTRDWAKAATLFPILTNRFLQVRLDSSSQGGGAFTVTDRRTKRVWRQKNFSHDLLLVTATPIITPVLATRVKKAPVVATKKNPSKNGAKVSSAQGAALELWDIANDQTWRATLRLAPDKPEVTVSIEGDAAATVSQLVNYPQPFATGTGTSLVVPLNEGILYPADDASIPSMQLVAYGGHGISMPWYGVTHDKSGAGVMTILHTPDDARIDLTRAPGVEGQTSNLLIRPQWEASRGKWSYARRATCVFFTSGGYVSQAKRYRETAQQKGLVKTLAQKKRERPAVDKLLGAVNVWNWDMDKVALSREMKSLGMDRVLWSSGGKAEEISRINALGYLTSRYDLFQDVWHPDSPSYLNHKGWPQDLVLLPDGKPMRGWDDVQTKPDGTKVTYEGGVICSSQQLLHAQERVPAELKKIAYACRFIDTTTASPWRECYNPAHPLTRSQDKRNKMQLLNLFSQDLKQVVGTETGIDPSVPFVDYYEGMMSLGPYRMPDAGREMMRPEEPTPDLLKFQVGHKYRVPLWELVYHDCVVSHWYWGDYNNKVPSVWARRDAFNVLYGTPPMFMFERATWQRDKPRFVQSYRDICPLVRKLSLDQMVSHEFLSSDHAVQRTRWKSGTEVIVNFGSAPHTLSDKRTIAPLKWLVK